jgi:hypothetical protein
MMNDDCGRGRHLVGSIERSVPRISSAVLADRDDCCNRPDLAVLVVEHDDLSTAPSFA